MKKPLDGKCPKCLHDIKKELSTRFWSDIPVYNFEFQCPHCDAILDIEVVPYPVFMVSESENLVSAGAAPGAQEQEGNNEHER
jgi:hypothetical protein